MKFFVIPRGSKKTIAPNTFYLAIDQWNDYSFVTMFHLSLYDEHENFHDIGHLKIGFKGQTTDKSTHSILSESFESLSPEFFSMSDDINYYRALSTLPTNLGAHILNALRDIANQPELIDEIKSETVFSTSLLRNTSLSVLKGQFARILKGKPKLTDFKLKFIRSDTKRHGRIDLNFEVAVDSKPSTNIHAIIGRNGTGKTTLLNGMINSITNNDLHCSFFDMQVTPEKKISSDYFSSLVSVSFSAFDSFSPPIDQPDPAKGTCYFYIGLKDPKNENKHRTVEDLHEECIKSLNKCFLNEGKTERWLRAIKTLGSDENFSSMNLEGFVEIFKKTCRLKTDNIYLDSESIDPMFRKKIARTLSQLSAGHAIVLLTMSSLAATMEEKTLVLIDEPECHLHPPLLSAFVRALSELLNDQNGVTILATHSPVVLQEIPKSCVWNICRAGNSTATFRPSTETFGENVGLITSEIFSLEVEQSGFHKLLANSSINGSQYEEIIKEFGNQIGFEGRSILKALIAHRDRIAKK